MKRKTPKNPKFPVKTSLQITKEQDTFVQSVADTLTELRGTGRRVSKKAAWRLMNDHCRTCGIFLTTVSINENVPTDEARI